MKILKVHLPKGEYPLTNAIPTYLIFLPNLEKDSTRWPTVGRAEGVAQVEDQLLPKAVIHSSDTGHSLLILKQHYCCQLYCTKQRRPKKKIEGSGCGAVGRAVAFNSKGPGFESSHRQLLLNIYLLLTVCRKDENKEKEAGNGPFLYKRVLRFLLK